ncbi:MAG: hypothetical protein EXR75_15275, partial [Myxococcales bacterium]|nr:hypothetical protein [Myxococcales bacterium]
AEVRRSAFAQLGPVSMATVGLAAFVVLYAASLFAFRPRQLRLVALGSSIAAVLALGLIGVQLFIVRAVCAWCMAVDGAAIAAAFFAVLRARGVSDPEPRWLRGVWAFAGVVVLAVPLGLGDAPPSYGPELPASITVERRPGKTTIVMFTDFECPFCRIVHTALEARVALDPARFRVVRKMVPLAGHDGAEPAARAYVCTPEAERDRMADKLYRAATEAMTKEGVLGMARELGLDQAVFARCYDDVATGSAIATDKAAFVALELRGLPSTFVADKLILGANLRALEHAIDGLELRALFAVVLGTLALAALVAFAERRLV